MMVIVFVLIAWIIGMTAMACLLFLSYAQDTGEDPEVAVMGAGMVLFWPAVLAVAGYVAARTRWIQHRQQTSPRPPCVTCALNGVTCTQGTQRDCES